MTSISNDEAQSSDVFVINPDNIVVKSPIRILYQEEKIGIENLLTFFSFRRISARLRRLIEHAAQRAITNFIKAKGYGDIELKVDLNFMEKTTNLMIRLPEEEIIDKNETIDVTGHLFSLTCRNIPEYSIREYFLLPMSDDYLRFFVLLVSYKPEIKDTLENLNKILTYPFFTLPNDKGEYYSSEWDKDNIYVPPKIMRLIVFHKASRYMFDNDIYGGQNQIIDYCYQPSQYMRPLTKDFIAKLLKDLAHLIDDPTFTSVVKDILEVANKLLTGQPIDRAEVRKVIKILSGITKGDKEKNTLNSLLRYLKSFLREMELFENLENICVARAVLRRISSILSNVHNKTNLRRISANFLRNYFFAGSIAVRTRKRLINLGGGKAIYLSPREWAMLIKDKNITNDKVRIELKIVKRCDGRKSIVIDIIE